ncbi:hypothetical protein CQW23_30884 [Capsicum baccatum]|uniref:Uncharacterized protein n=1 Tax=Capsicum baccatum TaxID=33114 RepID=A0A2G2V955_CAPBA|nr:hypothetical protein CQW23_30884 [Capsicum baccatum]
MFLRFNPQTLKDAIKIAGMQQKALGAVEKMGKRSARDVKPITRPFTPKVGVFNLYLILLELNSSILLVKFVRTLCVEQTQLHQLPLNLLGRKILEFQLRRLGAFDAEETICSYPNLDKSSNSLTIIGVANYVGENVGILPGKACNKFPPWVILLVGVCLSFFGYGVLWIAVSQTVLSLPYWVGTSANVCCIHSVHWIFYTGGGVVTKGKGYRIHSIRVDGTDAIAVFTTVQEARKIVVNEHKPVLVEVNCTLFEMEAYASCGSVVNCFFYVQHALRIQILSGLQDDLYNVYSGTKKLKELWRALERNYKTEDARTKKFFIARFLKYKMIDNKSVVSQVQELQVIIHDLLADGLIVNEAFQVAAIIKKLPPI